MKPTSRKHPSPAVTEVIEALDIALAIDPVDPKLALRIAFCLGAIATVGLDTKGRSEAKEWLETEFERLMLEVGYGDRPAEQ